MRREHVSRQRKSSLRFSEAEYEIVREKAESLTLTISEYMRRRSLGYHINVTSRTDLKTLAELRRLGGLVKHLHNESRGRYSELTAEALRELISCVSALERVIKRDSKNSA